MQLTRLTTRFVENEDRFLISADSEEGIMNLWLTQRLLKRLMPHLIEWVGHDDAPASASNTATASNQRDAVEPQVAANSAYALKDQAQSQLVAQYSNPQISSVPSDKAAQSCLVSTLRFEPRKELLRLVFVLPNDEAVLLLREEHARIWLGVLYKHWQQAQWPDIWPDWMKDAQQMRLAAPVSLMH